MLTFDQTFKILSALGAIATFLYTFYTWRVQQQQQFRAAQDDARHAAATHRIEATKPFLDRQLDLYTNIVRIVATLATTDEEAVGQQALKDFWALYYGELALVESPKVEDAMVRIGKILEKAAVPPTIVSGDNPVILEVFDPSQLKPLALQLTQAIRESLDRSWGISVWTNPDGTHRAGSK